MRGKRYIGEEVNITPTWDKSKLIWVTHEQWSEPNTDPNYPRSTVPHHNPSFWFEFDGWLYYGMVEYEFGFGEQYEDWIIDTFRDEGGKNITDVYFDEYSPGKIEFEMLTNFKAARNKISDPGVPYKTIYYKMDWEKANNEDNLDYYCKYETDFITVWNRERKLNELL